ncbi:hypothetical protein LTR34_010979 [Exophiala xenobiotica]|uniref:Ferric reductase NAD binding domain-containing protein n=1 Tax=Vermiconidia calcicola TaxID=1690605 RepID=A0AAV9PTB8_9PEZI|nr:hypothetical protein LTR34_010979 [Exophiala xenobiotica]KAK5527685.1 hypothetical protein LTR25_010963 [Vermiconidia calcicola]KAK5530201.1 hypothetical protein LTR23_010463 [Chaetothyriales sp. CCFEE 6169]
MIEPRCGWTPKLLRRAQALHPAGDEALSANSYLTLFSGPHGRSIGVENYGVVILVASGWGLMAQMPYLQALIRGFHNGTVKAQRIYLFWQLKTVADGAAARDLLNRALLDDTFDNAYILSISIYHLHDRIGAEELRLGRRVTLYEGAASWESLIHNTVAWRPSRPEDHACRNVADLNPSAFVASARRTIVMVSAAEPIRRRVRDACQQHRSAELQLVELDYQPQE